MESPADNTSKRIANSQANATVMETKLRTIFGSTKKSFYIIKEQKYEIKKHPFSLETANSESENTQENVGQQTSQAYEKPVDTRTSKENWTGNIHKFTDCDNVIDETLNSEKRHKSYPVKTFNNQVDPMEQEMYDCEEVIGDHIDTDKQKVHQFKKSTVEESKELEYKPCSKDSKDVLNNVSEVKRISNELNAVFKHRLSEIESKAPDDLVLQIRTYQEWIESLLKRNIAVIKTLNSLKEELRGCIEIPAINADTRLRFYRDRDVLVKFIQDAFHNDIWDLDYLTLETVSLAEFLKRDLVISNAYNDSNKMHSAMNKKQLRRKKSHFTSTSLHE